MKADHFFENEYYLLTNQSVSGNLLFSNVDSRIFFLKKVEKYLSELVELKSYLLLADEFRLLIKTKSRKDFILFFREKHKELEVEEFFIPKSTYILSQQMSNLQVSFAKWSNHKRGREGTLFASRFTKFHIETFEEFEIVKRSLEKESKRIHHQLVREKKFGKSIHSELYSSEMIGVKKDGGILGHVIDCYSEVNMEDLRGCLKKSCANHLISPFFRKLIAQSRKNQKFISLLN